MNLRDFLNYRTKCPLCNHSLETFFNSISGRKHQALINSEKNIVKVIFSMDSLNRFNKTYQIIYEFDLEYNNFRVNFANKDGIVYEDSVPIFLCERFKSFHRNMKGFEFSRSCSHCEKYILKSISIYMSHELQYFTDPEIKEEKSILVQEINSKYKIYRLINHIIDKKSELLIWYSNNSTLTINSWPSPGEITEFLLPIIPLTTKEKTIDRLNNLMPYS